MNVLMEGGKSLTCREFPADESVDRFHSCPFPSYNPPLPAMPTNTSFSDISMA